MIVQATTVLAEPIGVMLPPRFAPKTTAHHCTAGTAAASAGVGPKIVASIAASGMLSVTELNSAVNHIRPTLPAPPSAWVRLLSATPIICSTSALANPVRGGEAGLEIRRQRETGRRKTESSSAAPATTADTRFSGTS